MEKNVFDLVRLGLAVAVVYTHAHLLGGFGPEGFGQWTHDQTIAGSLAVLGFFGVSGFLVTRSFFQRADALVFIRARLLRILPGYYLALILSAFVLAPMISALNVQGERWEIGAAWRFLSRNGLVRIGEWHVGGVIRGLPYEGSLNGSLWSLWPECICYGLVLFTGMLGGLNGRVVFVYGFTALLGAMHVGLLMAPEHAASLVPAVLRLTGWLPFFTAFFVGACTYVSRERLSLGWRGAVFWGIGTLILLRSGGWSLAGPLLMPLFIINLSYSWGWHLPFDLSYGIYVLHFPVLQLLSATSVRHFAFGWYFAAGLAITMALAGVSWIAVERPFLRLKRRT